MSLETFSPKDSGEGIFYGIDFAALLDIGETISSATASVRVLTGTDPAANDMRSGTPVIGGSIVSQKIIGGVPGCIYRIGITILTSAGQTFIEGADLLCEEQD